MNVRGSLFMKRILSCGLVCLVLCLMGLAIWAKVSASVSVMGENNEYTYLAIVNRFDSPETMLNFAEGEVDKSHLDITHTVHAVLCFSRPVLLILPEGTVAEEDCSYVGARVTFDKPFDTFLDHNGFEIPTIPFGAILEPKRVEIVGDIVYGVVVESNENYIILDARDESAQPTGIHSRYSITPDTLIWYKEPFQPGSGCEAIVDKDGAVLAMQEANG